VATDVREFLESYDLYTRFQPHKSVWWNGDWPQVVEVLCRACGAKRSHRVWPSKVAGFTLEWGVYMLHGACEHCGTDGVIFWVEVNQREGWMQKAGQLPALPEASARKRSLQPAGSA